MLKPADLTDLMICRVPGLRGEEKIELIKKIDGKEDFSLFSRWDIEKLLGRALEEQAWNMAEIRRAAEQDAIRADKLGIHRVSWREKEYPPLLREIFDPPAVLFFRGLLPDPVKPLVAVVGTRKPSSAAAKRAFALGRELGEAGLPVVSGLALGIDAMAHRGNIEGRGRTIAVLGSGPDMVYPASNRGLARRILETGGLLISEYPPGTEPFRWNFPARNRIISALARGTVIVEAPEKSGALITARFALEHGRDLWVDRAGLSSPHGSGTAGLADEGAGLISSAAEILAEWNMTGPEKKEKETDKDTARKEGAGLAASLADYLDIKL